MKRVVRTSKLSKPVTLMHPALHAGDPQTSNSFSKLVLKLQPSLLSFDSCQFSGGVTFGFDHLIITILLFGQKSDPKLIERTQGSQSNLAFRLGTPKLGGIKTILFISLDQF